MSNNNIQVSAWVSFSPNALYTLSYPVLSPKRPTAMGYITRVASANGGHCQEIWAQDKKGFKVFIIVPVDTG